MNSIKEDIINRGLQSNAKILLPEIDDARVQEAIKELTSIGYKIVSIDNYSSGSKRNHIKNKRVKYIKLNFI